MKQFSFSCIESRIDDPKNVYARFKIGPFEKNHTITIANNLRRALLSELDGIAITAVKIQGVLHEYSSLPGVRESVLDILLNIKQVVLTGAFKINSPHLAYLKAVGSQTVTAGDIKLPPFLKCVDPNQPIATLCHDGQLSIVFLICPGKNYWVQLAANQFSNYYSKAFPNPIPFSGKEVIDPAKEFMEFPHFKKSNILTIDAVFMPINRVNYSIEIDEEIDTEFPEEHIFMEIWTNGSIHPRTAIELASSAVIEIFKPFQNLSSLQPRLIRLKSNSTSNIQKHALRARHAPLSDASRPEAPAKQPPKKSPVGVGAQTQATKTSTKTGLPGGRPLDPCGTSAPKAQPVLNLDIGNLNLSLRPFSCLKREGIDDIRSLILHSREDLLLFKNFGKKSLEEVETSLFELGLFLSDKSIYALKARNQKKPHTNTQAKPSPN